MKVGSQEGGVLLFIIEDGQPNAPQPQLPFL